MLLFLSHFKHFLSIMYIFIVLLLLICIRFMKSISHTFFILTCSKIFYLLKLFGSMNIIILCKNRTFISYFLFIKSKLLPIFFSIICFLLHFSVIFAEWLIAWLFTQIIKHNRWVCAKFIWILFASFFLIINIW